MRATKDNAVETSPASHGMRTLERRERLARSGFLQRLRDKGHEVEADKVIARDNIYRLDGAGHLMIRTSRLYAPREVYFFGLTRHIFENFAHIPNSVIAFVLADTGEALLIPAAWMWEHRRRLSADDKAFKVEMDKALRLKTYSPSGTLDLSGFRERFELLGAPHDVFPVKPEPKRVLDKHSQMQGMLLEIGNARGLQTYCPNRSPRFNGTPLGNLSTIRQLPTFPGLNNNIVRQIDVIWLDKSFPVHAFEIELTTGIWSGLVRLAELRRLNTLFHVVTADDESAFKRRIAGDIFAEIIARCHHANVGEISRLYTAQMQLTELGRKLAF
jgi:hypothetical protein